MAESIVCPACGKTVASDAMQAAKPRSWRTWGLPLVCQVCARKGPERLRWDIEAERRMAEQRRQIVGQNPTHIVFDDAVPEFPSERPPAPPWPGLPIESTPPLLEPAPKVQAWVITGPDRRFLRSIRITAD
jgi:hypothetical protein